MSSDIQIGYLFGYTTLVREGDVLVALRGETEPELRIGARVVLVGDSRQYVPSGFRHGQEVSIVGFVEPNKDGESDNIVIVEDEKHRDRVKPSNIQRGRVERLAGTTHDKRHLDLRKRSHPAVGELFDAVYLAMTEEEKASLSNDRGEYVDAMVRFALSRLEAFGHLLAEAVSRKYAESPHGERFIRDPIRTNSIVAATLFLDSDGELVSLKNPEIIWDTSIPSELKIARYESYEVLTGPLKGKRVLWNDERSLGAPTYRRGQSFPCTSPGEAGSEGLKVFLCHSSADKNSVRQLHANLLKDGLRPWLDAVDLRPGCDWKTEIERAVRDSDVVLVCLSQSSVGKTEFVQKEIALALDAADERPEGSVYIVPARLETCEVPRRLGKWQWVDLFEADGYPRLLKALKSDHRHQA